ncbi:hypothetical protein [Mycolicibacterium fortuitum]|uniref:hypothetical protein n=1 Tax=Mycolicibacterium fortuitum TaxID=1766 RepID=UPI000AFDD796|nr:hypothetical protein [Mycolicibacterium fortuitum]
MALFTDGEARYLKARALGRLATSGKAGIPHVVPANYVFNIDELLKLWSRVLSTWSVVNVYVRSRRLEFGLPWFSDDENASLVSTLSTSESPLSDFSHVHNGLGHKPPASMDMAHTWLRSYLAWDKDKLDRTLQSDDQAFGHEGVTGYQEHARKAGLFLTALQSVIKQIDDDGWPDRPVAT